MAACDSAISLYIWKKKDGLINCFESIVRNHPSALSTLQTAHNDGVDILSQFGFQFSRNENWTDFCECWFEFEYFDFIKGTCIDEAIIQNVLHNLRNDVCPHVNSNVMEIDFEDKTDGVKPHSTAVSLFHAAAASGNKDCLQYLLRNNSVKTIDELCQSKCGVIPEQIAVVKDKKGTFKMLIKTRHIYETSPFPPKTIFTFAKRIKSNGRVVVVKHSFFNALSVSRYRRLGSGRPKSDYYRTSVYTLLKFSENMSDKVLNSVINKLYLDSDQVLDIVTHLLFYGKFANALQILKNTSSQKLRECKDLIFAVCILNDADDVLRYMLQRNIHINKLVFKYNFLDIAIAFGRNNVLVKLKTLLKPSNAMQKESPYTFMIRLTEEYAWDDHTTEFLCSLCKGHDINHQDKRKKTPLHHAIVRLGYHPVIIHTLLELGADVNINIGTRARTPVFAAISPYNVHCCSILHVRKNSLICNSRALLKELLFKNPVTDLDPPIMYKYGFRSFMNTALQGDLNNEHLTYITKASRVVIKDRSCPGMGEKTQAGMEVTLSEDEQVLAVSNTALLVEYGFKMTAQDFSYLYSLPEDSYKPNVTFLSSYLRKSQALPLTLKAACRLAIRKHNPGTLLHKMLIQINLPKSIKDYILFANRLKFVEYTYMNDTYGDCVDDSPYSNNKCLEELMY